MWVGNRAKTVRKLQLVTLDKNENLELTKNAQSRHVIERELCAARIFFIYADMEFVKNFTPSDFQDKNFTPSISPNFNGFSKKKHKK